MRRLIPAGTLPVGVVPRSRGASGEGSTRRMRASQSGSHQFHRPKVVTRAGTSNARTMVASMRMPTPWAVPSTLISVPGDLREVAILALLAEREPTSQRDLGELLLVNRSVMVKFLDVMEARAGSPVRATHRTVARTHCD